MEIRTKEIKVAAVLPTYNRKEYLVECLQAILSQTFHVSDIYITDNNSTDGTEFLLLDKGLIDVVNGTHIHYKKLNINGGGAKGFSLGMKTAYNDGADAFWMMDDDGLPDTKALEILVPYLEKYNFVAPIVLSRTNRDKLCGLVKGSYDPNILLDIYHNKVMKGYVNPFNGGLFSRKLVKEVGFPKEELFIYGDELNYKERCEDKGYICYGIFDAKHYHPNFNVNDHERWGKMVRFIKKPLSMYCQNRNIVYNTKRRFRKQPLKSLAKLLYMPIEYNLFILLKHPSCKWFNIINKAYFDGLFNRWGGQYKYMK